jgi:hypothetical protein
LGGRGRQISDFEASLVYRVSSRTARAIQRNPVSKQNKTKQNKTKQNKTKQSKAKQSKANLIKFTVKRKLYFSPSILRRIIEPLISSLFYHTCF